MTEKKFDKIVAECWDACNEAANEGLGVSATSMSYEYYEDADEIDVWNDTICDFKDAILSYNERYEDFDYEEEFARLSDVLDDLWK